MRGIVSIGTFPITSVISSTPHTAPRTTCDHCLAPSTYMRRDTAGNTYRSCPAHSIEMEIMVREINEWGES